VGIRGRGAAATARPDELRMVVVGDGEAQARVEFHDSGKLLRIEVLEWPEGQPAPVAALIRFTDDEETEVRLVEFATSRLEAEVRIESPAGEYALVFAPVGTSTQEGVS